MMLRLSFPLKRLLFAPLYLAVTLITIWNLGDPIERSTELIVGTCVGFTASFIVSGFIVYLVQLRKTKNYAIALEVFQKQLNEEEA